MALFMNAEQLSKLDPRQQLFLKNRVQEMKKRELQVVNFIKTEINKDVGNISPELIVNKAVVLASIKSERQELALFFDGVI